MDGPSDYDPNYDYFSEHVKISLGIYNHWVLNE